MKTYCCHFYGYHPVGACLVVVAENDVDAFEEVKVALAQMQLLEKNKDLTIESLIPIDIESPNVIVLLDGNY